MIGIDYYSPCFIKSLTDFAHGCDSLDELKKTEYWLWYKVNEIIEFSKGNRDFLAGYYSGNGPEVLEVPLILNPRYKKKILKDKNREGEYETIVISHYAFDNSYKPKWKKHIYRCNKYTYLSLVEHTKAKKSKALIE